jgi:hypothetical protein
MQLGKSAEEQYDLSQPRSPGFCGTGILQLRMHARNFVCLRVLPYVLSTRRAHRLFRNVEKFLAFWPWLETSFKMGISKDCELVE